MLLRLVKNVSSIELNMPLSSGVGRFEDGCSVDGLSRFVTGNRHW